jgi:uncharacterized protein with ParB-like and HNH nuclease domain
MKEGISVLKEFFGGSNIFYIPNYQRDYSWDKEKQLKDFWEDIRYLGNDKKYFMGTILLQKGNSVKDKSGVNEFDQWEIIDGQQRLITISIFLSVVIKTAVSKLNSKLGETIKEEIKKSLLDKIELSYNKYLNQFGLDKVIPSKNDLEFYKHYIIDYNNVPNDTVTPSQRRIKEAREYFERKFKNKSIDEIISLINKIENIRFVIYPVLEKTDAVLIFETINDRGKPLTNLDKMKSFLMYMVYLSSEEYNLNKEILKNKDPDEVQTIINEINESEKLLSQIEEKFGNIFKYLDLMEKNGFRQDEEDILRYHYALWSEIDAGSYDNSFQYMDNLKRYFRKLIREDKKNINKEVKKYVESLEIVFFTLKSIFVDLLNDKSDGKKELKNTISKIMLLKRVANFYPVIISYWLKNSNSVQNILSFFKIIEKYVFQVYLIGRKRADAGAAYLYPFAHKLYIDEINSKTTINKIKELANRYIDYDFFVLNLKHKKFYNILSSDEVKYIFYHYEEKLRKDTKEPIEFELKNILGIEYNVEHILAKELEIKDRPKSLRNEQLWNDNINKLGNLTLCTRSWNSSFGKKRFQLKKTCKKINPDEVNPNEYYCYQKSIFKCQQELARFNDFGKNQIKQRENALVDFIINHWRI